MLEHSQLWFSATKGDDTDTDTDACSNRDASNSAHPGMDSSITFVWKKCHEDGTWLEKNAKKIEDEHEDSECICIVVRTVSKKLTSKHALRNFAAQEIYGQYSGQLAYQHEVSLSKSTTDKISFAVSELNSYGRFVVKRHPTTRCSPDCADIEDESGWTRRFTEGGRTVRDFCPKWNRRWSPQPSTHVPERPWCNAGSPKGCCLVRASCLRGHGPPSAQRWFSVL